MCGERRPQRGSARDLRDPLLICLTFGAGAVDAISFLGLGVFTANMTGNLVLLGVAVGRRAGSDVLRAAVSVVGYTTGVFAASRLVRRNGAPRSWPLGVTVALGVEALAQTGFLAGWLSAGGRPATALGTVLVAASAFAMGLQSGAVGALRVSGVTTTYVTGTLTGLVAEVGSGSPPRPDWTRRVAVLAALVAGAAGAALLLVGPRRAAPALPLVVTLAVATTAAHTIGKEIEERSDEGSGLRGHEASRRPRGGGRRA